MNGTTINMNGTAALLNCVTIDTFKRKLDCHLKNRGYF